MILIAEVVGLFESFVALGFKTGKKVSEQNVYFMLMLKSCCICLHSWQDGF